MWQAQIHTIYVDSILIMEENENIILRLTTVLLLTLTSDISSLEKRAMSFCMMYYTNFSQTVPDYLLQIIKDKIVYFFIIMEIFFFL